MIIENQLFEKAGIQTTLPASREFENCTFRNCNFFNTDFSGYVFRECRFEECDLSMVKLKNTTLNEVHFEGCKAVGVQFGECNSFLLNLSFDKCDLKLSGFYRLKLKKVKFIACNLQEADFTSADLSQAYLADCDLQRAVFEMTVLEKADFRSAFNFNIDPERNRIKKAIFSRNSIDGLLAKYNIEIE